MEHELDVDVDPDERAGQEVIGYSPDGGFLIREDRRGAGRSVWLHPDDLVEVEMADPVDQKVFGVGGDEPVVKVRRDRPADGYLRRYTARDMRFAWRGSRPAPVSDGGRA